MSILLIIMLAIVIASCTFGLNQIIIMADDIKFVKSVLKDHVIPRPVVEEEAST